MKTDLQQVRPWTENESLNRWIEEIAALCRPARIHVCDGSEAEYQRLADELCSSGKLTRLNPDKRPNSFWCRSHPDDVARVEECTFICSTQEEDAGPTNHWRDPVQMKGKLKELFSGCMEGRTLYLVPYLMGPVGSPFSVVGVEATDSAYVVMNMKLMTRMGTAALKQLGQGKFVPGVHSVGAPLKPGDMPIMAQESVFGKASAWILDQQSGAEAAQLNKLGDAGGSESQDASAAKNRFLSHDRHEDSFWPCNPKERCIVHFPEERSIWSFGSGYGGNALLGKKCLALRIASVMGRDEGWLAEHMLILGITNPEGEKKYIAAAFPSACGKTNLAMLTPTLPGWKIECVGDDIAWIRKGADGRLYAINPEAGYFGVAPGTSMKTNPNAMRTIEQNALFTNVALTPDGDVWWEGMDKEAPVGTLSWLGTVWDRTSGPAAHPNARFTVSSQQCPIFDPAAEAPQGVPLSAIIFGGRRDSVIPLVFESLSWQHGVFLGASISSEMTAAAKGEIGKLRHDPFAMLPFCGYHMGDYFAHWLEMGEGSDAEKLPRIYYVNWFRKNQEGKFIWPGFGENSRVLKWIFERTSSRASARSTPIGSIPESLDLSQLPLANEQVASLFAIDRQAWLEEVGRLRAYFKLFNHKFPERLHEELENLRKRLE